MRLEKIVVLRGGDQDDLMVAAAEKEEKMAAESRDASADWSVRLTAQLLLDELRILCHTLELLPRSEEGEAPSRLHKLQEL